ncbi:MAG: glycosyltransferase, partial [Dorea sp.]|nr:glycosyltransferase [Dorea sp.]
LASDRRESLERCLDSLKPLLVKLPSELIIVFTGTDPKVREIAETYTPQVIPFTWRGDFSAARNAGLKEAQGEWFLYIDDDEWFDSVDEICEFFLSGEYRRYRSAHYIQRNYQEWNGTKYSDFSVFRMIQRFPESRFRGAIHEELELRMEPCRYFETCVHHYGYVKSDGEVLKTTRNIPMLLQSIENHPKQIKNYIQLAKEFDLAGDWKSAEEYCRKGRRLCQTLDDPYSEGWLQAYLAHLVSEKPGKAPAVSELEIILAKERPSELTGLILYQQLICLYAEEKEAEKAVRYGWKFEKLLREMDENPALWEQQGYGEFCEGYIKNPERLYGARAKCAACALETHDFTSAAYFLKLFPWENEDILRKYYPELEKWKEIYAAPYIEILLEILAEIDSGTSSPTYLLFQKAMETYKNEKNNSGLDLFVYCMSHAKDSDIQRQLLKEAIRRQVSVIPLASRIDLDTWDNLAEKVVGELPFTLNRCIRVCEEEIGKRYPLHSLCMKRQRLVQKLRKGFPLWEELTAVLEEYCQCTVEFYKGLFQDKLFGEEMRAFLPAKCRFAQITLKAMEEFRQEKTAEAVRLLGVAYHTCPDMAGVIIEVFRQAARRTDNPALHAGAEFSQLAAQMKGMLHALMEGGQNPQADEILNQLLPLMPEDLELIRVRQELIRRRKS